MCCAGLVKYTSTIELPDTTFGTLNDQVALATGKTPLALRLNGQSMNEVAGQCAGSCSISRILGLMHSPSTTVTLTADFGGSQSSDPIINGFDGSV